MVLDTENFTTITVENVRTNASKQYDSGAVYLVIGDKTIAYAQCGSSAVSNYAARVTIDVSNKSSVTLTAYTPAFSNLGSDGPSSSVSIGSITVE